MDFLKDKKRLDEAIKTASSEEEIKALIEEYKSKGYPKLDDLVRKFPEEKSNKAQDELLMKEYMKGLPKSSSNDYNKSKEDEKAILKEAKKRALVKKSK